MNDISFSMERLFRFAFWLIFGGMILLQAYFALRVRPAGEQMSSDREAIGREGRVYAFVRGVRSLFLVVVLVLYALNPWWLGMFSVPLPGWLRGMGVALGAFSLALYAWSRVTLGEEWSSSLQLRQNHQLVTTGPYNQIRHPIYLAMLLFLMSIALVAAHWFFIVLLLFSAVDLPIRIPKEEQMMIEVFGDEYNTYMQRSGRLFPKIRWSKHSPARIGNEAGSDNLDE